MTVFGFPVRGTVCPHSYGVRLPMQPTARPDSQRLASATSNGASVHANVVLPAQSTVRPNALCVWLSGASYGSPPQPMFGFRYKLRRVGTVAAFDVRCTLRRAPTSTMLECFASDKINSAPPQPMFGFRHKLRRVRTVTVCSGSLPMT